PLPTDQQGKTALHTAVEAEFSFDVFAYTHTSYRYVTKRKKKKSIVKLLIDKGSNPCMRDKQGRTALHYAAERGCSDSFHLLLGNNPMPFIKDEQGRTPLHCAAAKGSRDNVELLLDKGADLCAKDQQGRTPLHCAAEAESDCSEIVKLLLEKGADPLMMDQQGMTALDYATRCGNTASVKLLHGRVSEKQ
ncbi:serine/threonine-protein phosphatase 6 regulatory ankyrin repeat subunit C-like, partial [Haliotis rufescens]|uniref:serine/threonine-protein phosphatase 6 regulatory ankyrin repeat subunit C-like n=1 Tax=Haliotis rufescens TaxID=6454 RepID=UPI00201EAF90